MSSKVKIAQLAHPTNRTAHKLCIFEVQMKLSRMFRYLPWTKSFQSYEKKALAKKIREQMLNIRKLRNTEGIDNNLIRSIRSHVKCNALFRVRSTHWDTLYIDIVILTAFVLALIAPIPAIYHGMNVQWYNCLLVVPTIFVASLAFWGIAEIMILDIFRIFSKKTKALYGLIYTVTVVSCLVSIYDSTIKSNINSNLKIFIIAGTIQVGVFVLSTTVHMIILAILYITEQFYAYRVSPLSQLVEQHINILLLLNDSKGLSLLSVRGKILQSLDEICHIFSKCIPRFLDTGDELFGLTLKEVGKEISGYYRTLKRWILTPKSDTHNTLKETLTKNLILIMHGHWDGLERFQPDSPNVPQRLQLIAACIKTILVGVAPISLIYIAKYYQFGLSAPFDSIITLGAALWCIVCFIIALDPNVAVKIAIMKDFKAAIPSLGKDDKGK